MSDPENLYDDALLLFFDEARDMLQQIESALLAWGQASVDPDAVHALFRAAHTIKGTSGIFNLHRVVRFTHEFESVLDRVRKGTLALDEGLASVLLAGCDMIGELLLQVERHCDDADELSASDAGAAALGARLAAYLTPAAKHASGADALPEAVPARLSPTEPQSTAPCWHVSLRFAADTFRYGFDPLTILQYLAKLGRIVAVATVDEGIPDWDRFDPESCFLGFELRLETAGTRQDIADAFEFIGDQCEVRIYPPSRRATDYIELINALPHEQRLGDLLVACGAVTRAGLDAALASQREQAGDGGETLPLGQILVAGQQVAPVVLDAALERQARGAAARQETGLFVRVPADKLDDLINMVGELVICGASASLQAQQAGHAALIGTTQQLGRLVEEIRNGALGLRMVRIGETFTRYRRVVHDTAHELGKAVKLEIHGSDTELDKSVVEKIGDPLMHLVRNALDHGIEPPATRLAAGKPAEGTIWLSARHDSGNIVIVVRDDGRGLDGAMLQAKACEKGLVAPDQVLSTAEQLELIFMAGFSTASQITNLSGRGVGMDVVRKNIEALRGTVRLDSVPGQGTAIEICLPLTLAIIDGFLVTVDGSAFVIPLHAVLECIDAGAAELNMGGKTAGFIKLRGQVLPVLDVRRVFGIEEASSAKCRIVVVQGAGGNAGLLVDHIVGEYQIVIKPLGKLFRQLRGISGSAVLGSGEVALILDVAALIKLANQQSLGGSGHWQAAPQPSGMALRHF